MDCSTESENDSQHNTHASFQQPPANNGHIQVQRRGPGRRIQQVGNVHVLPLTTSEERLIKRRALNRASARRSRQRRIDFAEQASLEIVQLRHQLDYARWEADQWRHLALTLELKSRCATRIFQVASDGKPFHQRAHPIVKITTLTFQEYKRMSLNLWKRTAPRETAYFRLSNVQYSLLAS
ncbi:hypothetical protein WJX84_000457 [Apatococcus fuscideae]|uniref:BZIP domain-containing protein n=1 Tax=Apatococcus fuscideae TaxID=2026836 RepID=A0AAW1T3Y7_9CHLO